MSALLAGPGALSSPRHESIPTVDASRQGWARWFPQLADGQKRPWRLAELGLLALALAVGIGAYAIIGYTVTGSMPEDFTQKALLLAGLAAFMHIMVRLFAPWADQVILPCVILLYGIGSAMIYRIGLAGVNGADASRNMLWAAVSMGAAALTLIVIHDHRMLRRFTYISMVVGLVLLALPIVPGLGRTINGARRWIGIGPFSLQPSEFAKVALAIFFAGYFRINRDNLALAGPKIWRVQLPRLKDLGPIALVWAASIGVLVLQTDLGMSLLIFGLFVAMLYLATQRVSWLLIGGVMFVIGAVLAIGAFPHVMARMDVWFNAMDPAVYDRSPGGSFQLVQGLFGMANGGLIGTGWGRGFPYLVPLSFSDFIFPAIGEEIGLTGLLAILVIFMIIVERGLRTALSVRDGFGKLLAAGLSFLFALQLFTIIGGVTRLLPLTGLTVPFMAQGGSSMMANWIVVALLLRISDAARRPSQDPGLGEIAGAAALSEQPQEVIVPGQSFTETPVILREQNPVILREQTPVILRTATPLGRSVNSAAESSPQTVLVADGQAPGFCDPASWPQNDRLGGQATEFIPIGGRDE